MLEFIPLPFRIFILSAIPVIEQKASIPVGLLAGLPVWEVYIITLFGAVLPSPFIIWFIDHVFKFLRRFSFMDRIITRFEKSTLRKSGNIEKYKLLGLLLFVAIPLPGTGVWTGSLASVLLGLGKKKSVGVVFLGAALAGFLILILSRGLGHLIL